MGHACEPQAAGGRGGAGWGRHVQVCSRGGSAHSCTNQPTPRQACAPLFSGQNSCSMGQCGACRRLSDGMPALPLSGLRQSPAAQRTHPEQARARWAVLRPSLPGTPRPAFYKPPAPRLRLRQRRQRAKDGACSAKHRKVRLPLCERAPAWRRQRGAQRPPTAQPPRCSAPPALRSPGNSSTASLFCSRRCMLKADTGTAPNVVMKSRKALRPSVAPLAAAGLPEAAPGRLPPSRPRSESRPRPAGCG